MSLVVVLGAGASRGMGLPLLSEIFSDPPVVDYLNSEAEQLLQFMHRFIWQPRGLTIVESASSLNIEEVMTLLKQWMKTSSSPISIEENQQIQKLLLGCVQKAVYVNKGNTERYYNDVIRWSNKEFESITWASFNWDVKFEQAFYYEMRGLGGGKRLPRYIDGVRGWEGNNTKHLMLKLHGSVSWFLHPDGVLYARRFGTRRRPVPIDESWSDFLSGRNNAKPLIAEPSFFKHDEVNDADKTILKRQWALFDEKLRDASQVIVCGYSMPEGDALAKQSLLTAFAANKSIKWKVVDISPEVIRRYERLLGKAAVEPFEMTFSKFVQSLA